MVKGPTRLLPGAVRRAAPATLKPVLATLVEAPPANPGDWIYEVKFDGYRILARVEARAVRLFTRNGHDWTAKLTHLAKALQALKLAPGWLDGEIVMLNEQGATSFQALQNAFDSARTADIVYYLFDVPWYDGYDLTGVPLIDRRTHLESLLARAPDSIRFSEAFDVEPRDLVASACKLGLEGIIGKKKRSSYSSRRTPDWIKLKCGQRQEFVIGGWTDPKGSRVGLGSLLLGVHDAAGALVYSGKVGSGFDDRKLVEITRKLKALATEKSPFNGPTADARHAHWVRPSLVAEVTFSEWTGDGHLRHPVFHALRTDKPATAIVRERPSAAAASGAPTGTKRAAAAKTKTTAKTKVGVKSRASARTKVAAETTPPARSGVTVSNPDRIVDPSTGVTKLDVVTYYEAVAPAMMEHLHGRPVSLVRAPQGVNGQTFFQKHAEKKQMEGVVLLSPSLDPDHPPYLEIAKPVGLAAAAQMNVIEFHTWNALKSAIDKPDRMTFDLDPGEGVGWAKMQQAAELVHGFLTEIGLPAFLKTSGGKGLHVVTPVRPHYDWDTVKGFSEAIVIHMAQALPRLFVAKSGPKNRVGRIFIDYLRNGFGATTACAWSARVRPGMGISVPVGWEELASLKSGAHWTVQNYRTRLGQGNGPWQGYRASARSLTAAMKAVEYSGPAK